MSLSDDDSDTDPSDGPPWVFDPSDCPIPEYSSHTHQEVVQSWIRLCDEHHGPKCHAKKTDSAAWPLWLIDVTEGCIVRGDKATRYLTLSYVWGGVHTLQATTSNIHDLQLSRSLVQQEDTLPKTIRQAMEFTRLIGERYIWIDQLCIPQDDDLAKESEIAHMAELYANSYLTLVAATGETAASGLANTLDLWSTTIRRRKYEHPDKHWFHDWALKDSSWSSRGWTFQENIFARRAIYFMERLVDSDKYDGLNWECEHALWMDLQGPMTLRRNRRLQPHNGRVEGLRHSSWPDLYEYSQLARSFAQRNFTYTSDVVPAFTGFANMLAKSFRGGILYGLPVLFFDVSLLWQAPPSSIQRVVDPLLRRQVRLPSWSWMSWQGELDLELWHATCQYMEQYSTASLIVRPLVEWYFFTGDNVRVAIESDYRKYQHLLGAAEGEMPGGWSRITREAFTPPKSHIYASATPRSYAYTHSVDTRIRFRYPIPLVDSAQIQVPQPTSTLITCRTERAWFSWSTKRLPYYSYTSLVDATGLWSGILMFVDDMLKTDQSTLANNDRCEVISISTGSVCQNQGMEFRIWFQEERHPERPSTGELYEFYNVLWIEWMEGIAYRKALGRVHKVAWEAAEREFIDVVLG